VRACCRRSTRSERAKLINPIATIRTSGPAIRIRSGRHEPVFCSTTLRNWNATAAKPKPTTAVARRAISTNRSAGTTSIEAADEEGWVVSVTPSGGWVPAVIAGARRHRL
jgi:gamma-glutamyltranspeptidase/glutathione hydrolase